MTEQHSPITPPPELINQWKDKWFDAKVKHIDLNSYLINEAARWGSDQELEACCADILQILAGIFEDKVEDWNHFVQLLRDGRRPPPQERALDALLEERANFGNVANFELIKSVLERLLDD
jgi:hypothetical protein